MKKLNNKGYMLVEIIMAFAITFILLYFMMDLVLKMKNKNDDLLVETVVRTDQTIITNVLMEYLKSDIDDNDEDSGKRFCDAIVIDGNIIKYKNNVIDIVEDYATVVDLGNDNKCKVEKGKISILIPIEVKQLKDERMDVIINYRYNIELKSYAIYSETDNSLVFYNNFDRPKKGEMYRNKKVTELYFDFEKNNYSSSSNIPWYEYRESITKVIVEDEIKPINIAYWFNGFKNAATMDVAKIDTSDVTNMRESFKECGTNVESFKIIGLSKWDLSNVTTIHSMFNGVAQNATSFSIGDLSKWDVSNVTDMSGLFYGMGNKAKSFEILGLANWDVSSVVDMHSMFNSIGKGATSFNIGDLSKWDVSSVTNMNAMFANFALSVIDFKLNLTGWNVSKVTDMGAMFYNIGNKANSFEILGLSNWNVSNVINMVSMFNSIGQNATSFNIGDLSNWDVSKVKNMSQLFANSALSTNVFNLDLSGWNVLNVKNMNAIFYNLGSKANTFKIIGLDDWNMKNVTDVGSMFYGVGEKASLFSIGDLSGWDVSSVTNMRTMFFHAGVNATSFNIGDIAKWNVSNVTDMSGMFNYTGYNVVYELDLSGWDVGNVKKRDEFDSWVESKIIDPSWIS